MTLLNLLLTPTPPTASDKFSPQASTDGRMPLALAELPPGSRLEATVLGRDGSGRPLLRTVYGTLAVISDLPLPRGTRLVLEVRPEATRLIAKIVSVNGSSADTALPPSALRPPPAAGPASATAAPLPATGRPAIAPTEPGPATAGNPAQAAPPTAPNVPLSAMAAQPAALPGTAAPEPDRVLPGAIAASPGMAPAANNFPRGSDRLDPHGAASPQNTSSKGGPTGTAGLPGTAQPVPTSDAGPSSGAGTISATARAQPTASASVGEALSVAGKTSALPASDGTPGPAQSPLRPGALSEPPSLIRAQPLEGASSDPRAPANARAADAPTTGTVAREGLTPQSRGPIQPRANNPQLPAGPAPRDFPAAGRDVARTPSAFVPMPAGAAAAQPPPLSAPLPLPAGAAPWPALARALSALGEQEPDLARQLMREAVPGPRAELLALLHGFTAALASGEMAGSPMLKSARPLERMGRAELVAELARELGQFVRLAEPADGNSWRVFLLPFSDGAQWHTVRLFTREEDGQAAADERGTRFLVEVDLSRLGPVQLDGLAEARRFRLVLRSRTPLPEDARRTIENIVEEASALSGAAGAIAFQTVATFPVDPLKEIGQAPRHGVTA